jgi:protein-disulfide isomerase
VRHGDHVPAAEAALEARAQRGDAGFWRFHDALLDHQDELTPRDLKRHAEAIGLDVDRFTEDLRRREHAERIADDVRGADASGVAGTPSFFINGQRYQGAYDRDTLSRVVRAARNRAAAVALASRAR